ncbi:uncharacterized protein LOC143024065 [Oratosquilla oratoria]|uniref:uncharacterized protein LOC143024065 n=1 Tax=Oratosquilla oratoria TaxID=337810 RepID=UPI003F757948
MAENLDQYRTKKRGTRALMSMYKERYIRGTDKNVVVADQLIDKSPPSLTEIKEAFRKPERSGFTPDWSETDWILAPRILVERRRDFQQGFLIAYVDLKKAFDLVYRRVFWDLLRIREIPARVIDLISGLYSGTDSHLQVACSPFLAVRL